MPIKLDQSATASRKALALFGLLLFGRRAYSLKQLAESLGCSRQTVLRLMEEVVHTNICRIKSWKEGGQNWLPSKRANTLGGTWSRAFWNALRQWMRCEKTRLSPAHTIPPLRSLVC
ncbi:MULTISPECIES: hypothetical protein [unclassified Desulfovibrio]|uniref:hypothetical protein n=1 Tax=unclassified Desulfovibrio TaxID=2593640 RepID=UPI002FD9A1EF